MKPPNFLYAAPRSLDEAAGARGTHGSDAMLLAGGQSLVRRSISASSCPRYLSI
jgi:CO/xanthine dehydrogenase FAD-binding subunit